MMENLVYLAYPLAYLLGSIPTAIWVSRALQLEDPTTQGSNNPGQRICCASVVKNQRL